MSTITKDYDTHTKDELLAEAKGRNLDVTAASSKADIVAALQLSDESKAKPQAQAIASTPPPKSLLPPGNTIPVIPRDPSEAPADEEYTGGIYTKDGEDFALATVEDSPSGRTHFLKNTVHFYNVTPDEFKAQFEKK